MNGGVFEELNWTPCNTTLKLHTCREGRNCQCTGRVVKQVDNYKYL